MLVAQSASVRVVETTYFLRLFSTCATRFSGSVTVDQNGANRP